MTVKVNSEGDFAENSVSNADSPESAIVLSDLYDVLIKGDYDERDFSIVTLAHEVRKAFGDKTDSESDVSQWCDIGDRYDSPSELRLIDKPSDMDSEPNLGRYFWKAVDYTANDYQKFEDKYESEADIRPLDAVNDEGEALKNHLIEQEIVEAEETIHVPVNSEGELIPPFVVSEERQEQVELEYDLPTYEEGIQRLQTLLNDHFGETVTTETDSANDNDGDSGSDGESDTGFKLADPTSIDGFGNKTLQKLEDNGFEVRATAKVMERAEMPDDSSDVDNFFDGDVTTIEGGIPKMEYDEGELLTRLNEIEGDVNGKIFDKIFEKIESGDYETAESFISNYE